MAEPGALNTAPMLYAASARLPPEAELDLQDHLADSLPSVTVIRVGPILRQVFDLLGRIAAGIRVLGSFTVLAGLAILAGVISSTSLGRGREAALLKTLGITRAGVTTLFAVEYGLCGAVAGARPVVTITGPRQSGKTTLCRMALPEKAYANLERPDLRAYALSDPPGLLDSILAGGYPRIHDQGLSPADWLSDCVTTYLERDVRQILNVGDLATFQIFLQLAAGSVGQLINLSALGSACGITHNTARVRLGVLEAGYIAYRLAPLHRDLKKRLARRPKLHFHDTGLACRLLGISSPDQLRFHPLRGALFECREMSEVLKARVHRGLRERMFFCRAHKGEEVDLVLDPGTALLAAEMRSGRTVPGDAFRGLDAFTRLVASRIPKTRILDRVLVYGGEERQQRTAGTVLPWQDIPNFDWDRE